VETVRTVEINTSGSGVRWNGLSAAAIGAVFAFAVGFLLIASIRNKEWHLLLVILPITAGALISSTVALLAWVIGRRKDVYRVIFIAVFPVLSISAFVKMYDLVLRVVVDWAPPLAASELSAFGVNTKSVWIWLVAILIFGLICRKAAYDALSQSIALVFRSISYACAVACILISMFALSKLFGF